MLRSVQATYLQVTGWAWSYNGTITTASPWGLLASAQPAARAAGLGLFYADAMVAATLSVRGGLHGWGCAWPEPLQWHAPGGCHACSVMVTCLSLP